jgi:hypothetical protein
MSGKSGLENGFLPISPTPLSRMRPDIVRSRTRTGWRSLSSSTVSPHIDLIQKEPSEERTVPGSHYAGRSKPLYENGLN